MESFHGDISSNPFQSDGLPEENPQAGGEASKIPRDIFEKIGVDLTVPDPDNMEFTHSAKPITSIQSFLREAFEEVSLEEEPFDEKKSAISSILSTQIKQLLQGDLYNDEAEDNPFPEEILRTQKTLKVAIEPPDVPKERENPQLTRRPGTRDLGASKVAMLGASLMPAKLLPSGPGLGEAAKAHKQGVSKAKEFSKVLITPKNVGEILKEMASNDGMDVKVLERLFKKYGAKVVDGSFLLQQVNSIVDEDQKKAALKHFVKFQLIALGHNFSIGGKIKLSPKNLLKLKFKDTQVELEGWYQSNTHLKLLHSLQNHFEKASSSKLDPEMKKTILESIATTITFREMKPDYEMLLQQWKEGKPIAIPTGWEGHAVEITLYKDYLVYSNRGQQTEEFVSGIHVYKIGKLDQINVDFLKKLHDCKGSFKERAKYFEDPTDKRGMHAKLDLKGPPIYSISKKNQSVGNCAWVSTKCGFQAELFLLHYEKLLDNIKKTVEFGKYCDEKVKEFEKGFTRYDPKKENVGYIKVFKDSLKYFITDEKLKDEIDKMENPYQQIQSDENFKKRFIAAIRGNKDLVHKFLLRTNKEQSIMDDAANLARRDFKNWDVDHRKSEWEFFCDFLSQQNSEGEILPNNVEFKILAQVFAKFYKVKSSQDPLQLDSTKQLVEVASKSMNHLAHQMLKKKDYTIEDAIVTAPVKGEMTEEIVKAILEDKSPGAFMIWDNGKGELSLTFKQKDVNGVVKIRTEKMRKKGDGSYSLDVLVPPKTVKTVKDVMSVLEEDFLLSSYPVLDEKYIIRELTGNEKLD